VEYEIHWGGDPEDVLVTTWGEASHEALDSYIRELVSDPRYEPGLLVLVDHRRADWDGFSAQDFRRRTDVVEQNAGRLGPQRLAMVVGSKAAYGLGRMWQTLLDSRSQLHVSVFEDIDAARAWLRDASPAQAARDAGRRERDTR
jgi:hypothetical protein